MFVEPHAAGRNTQDAWKLARNHYASCLTVKNAARYCSYFALPRCCPPFLLQAPVLSWMMDIGTATRALQVVWVPGSRFPVLACSQMTGGTS